MLKVGKRHLYIVWGPSAIADHLRSADTLSDPRATEGNEKPIY
jgi:hypothetical protein